MNNKKLGTRFEKTVCEILRGWGFWVHFITPDVTGAQPFDVIAVKDNDAYAIDCKTCKDDVFRISRLETNQILAFDLWLQKGNMNPKIFVEHCGHVYVIDYCKLKEKQKMKIEECLQIC